MPAKSLVAPAMLNGASGYIVAFVIVVAADMVWLGLMSPRLYRPILGDIAVSSVKLTPAIIFYTIYPIGLLLRDQSGAEQKITGGSFDLRCSVRLLHLCDLRPDKTRDATKLDVTANGC